MAAVAAVVVAALAAQQVERAAQVAIAVAGVVALDRTV